MSLTYTYKAMDKTGTTITSTMQAANDEELESRIVKMGMDLISFKSQKASNIFKGAKIVVPSTEIINFAFHLEQLTRAGVPLVDSIDDLRDSVELQAFKEVLDSISGSIQSGKSFSESLRDYPTVFDEVFVNMIEVAEKTGQMAEILHDLAEMTRWQNELVAKAKKIMMYPMFVFGVVFSVLLFLMWYLVPQLVGFLNNIGTELPVYTKALVATSDFVTNYWYVMIGVPIIIPVSISLGVKNSPSFHYSYDKLKLKFPIVGSISYKIKLARFASYFALMYSAGITVLDSINLSKKIMANVALEDALEKVYKQIEDGESIATSFESVGMFSPLIVRMVKIGESTGEMDRALKNISGFYSREVEEEIDKIEPAIQPIMTVFLGGMVAWIILSVIGPIYDVILNVG